MHGFLLVAALRMASSGHAAPLTLSDCLRLAREHSIEEQQGQLTVEQARATYKESSAARLPQLSAVGSWDKSDDSATQLPDANKGVLHVEEPLLPFSAEWQLPRQRRREYSAAELERLQQRRDVERRVRQLYFGILQSREAAASLDAVEVELDKLRLAVLPRYTIGRAPSFDLVKVRSGLADLARQRSDQGTQLVAQQAELAQTLGLDATAQLELSSTDSHPPIPSPAAVREGLQANPGLRALAEREAAAHLAVLAARYTHAPALVGSAEYGWSGQTSSDATRGWDVSVAMKMSIFDWGVIRSRIKQGLAAEGLTHAQRTLELQSLLSQALETRSKAEADLAQAQRLQTLLPDAKRASQTTIERYRRGGTSIIEATDAVNLWLTTWLQERASYYGYLGDLADLNWLQGLEPGTDGL